uniref:TLC domain-containing protein n=1 Tax=Gopherus evgoodei TaxID=1825980 RepID=A0A8C4YN16_9SAUR
MEESTRLGYCIVAGSFVAFQFFFSAVSPQLSLALSRHYSSLTAVKKCEWNSRCVSTLHALIVGLFCLYILFFDGAINANPICLTPGTLHTDLSPPPRSNPSLSLPIPDLLLLLRYWKTLGDSLFVCHHLVALYAYGYVLVSGKPGRPLWGRLPPLSLPPRSLWFFDTVGQPRSSWFVLANGLAMTVVFFLVRIAVIPSYYARMLAWYGTPEYARLGLAVQVAWIVPSLALEVLNLVWMYKIIRGFYRAFCRPREHKLACGHGD